MSPSPERLRPGTASRRRAAASTRVFSEPPASVERGRVAPSQEIPAAAGRPAPGARAWIAAALVALSAAAALLVGATTLHANGVACVGDGALPPYAAPVGTTDAGPSVRSSRPTAHLLPIRATRSAIAAETFGRRMASDPFRPSATPEHGIDSSCEELLRTMHGAIRFFVEAVTDDPFFLTAHPLAHDRWLWSVPRAGPRMVDHPGVNSVDRV